MIKSIALIAVAIIVVGNIGAQEALVPGGQATDEQMADEQEKSYLKNWETVIIWQDATKEGVQNIDVNSRGRSGNTPLHRAVQKDASFEVVDALLKNGASTRARDTGGSTPLHWAARYAKDFEGSRGSEDFEDFEGPEIVKLLLEQDGVQVDARDRDANTPLYLAVLHNTNNGVASIVTQLVGEKAKVGILDDQTGETLLHKAVRYNTNPEVVGALLDAFLVSIQNNITDGDETNNSDNVKIDTRDNGGNTALHNAIRHNKGIDIIRSLVYDNAGKMRTVYDDDGITITETDEDGNENEVVVVDAKDLNSVTPLDLLKEHEVLSYLYYEISDDLLDSRSQK